MWQYKFNCLKTYRSQTARLSIAFLIFFERFNYQEWRDWSDLKSDWSSVRVNPTAHRRQLSHIFSFIGLFYRSRQYFTFFPNAWISICQVPESFSNASSSPQFPRVNSCGKGLHNAVSVRRTHSTSFVEVSRYVLALISGRGMIKHVISVCRCDRTPEHTRVSPHTSLLTSILSSLLQHTCM